MTYSLDLEVRKSLDNHLLKIGEANPDSINKKLDISDLDSNCPHAEIYLSVGETGCINSYPKDRTWVEYFLVKSPKIYLTGTIETKHYQYGLWIKTELDKGLDHNEIISALIEEHFSKNKVLHLKEDRVLAINKVYQNATIILDRKTNRLFNRVFVDCTVSIDNG